MLSLNMLAKVAGNGESAEMCSEATECKGIFVHLSFLMIQPSFQSAEAQVGQYK